MPNVVAPITLPDGAVNKDVLFDWTTGPTGTNPLAANDHLGGVFPSGRLTIPAGQTAGAITISPNPDTTVEPDETGLLTVTPVTTGVTIDPPTRTYTFLNDDSAAPSNIYGPQTLADTGPQTVGTTTKYKMSGVFGGTAWKIYFGSTESDGTPGHVIEPANGSNYRMSPLAADGTQGTDNNWTYVAGGATAGTAYEIIHDRTANTLSVKIGDQTAYVRGISNPAGGPFFRGVLGGSTGTMTVVAVS